MQKTVRGCDICGTVPAENLRIRMNGQSYETDRCADCVKDMVLRKAKKGRVPGQ